MPTSARLSSADNETAVDIRVFTGRHLRGTVVEIGTGRPVPFCHVSPGRRTDADGRFEAYVTPGVHQASASDSMREDTDESSRNVDVPTDRDPEPVVLKVGPKHENTRQSGTWQKTVDVIPSTAPRADPQPAELMRVGVDAFFRYVEEHPFARRMMFRDTPSDPDVAAAYRRLERRATGGIAAFIEVGAGAALARFDDPRQAAEMFAEAVKGAQNGLATWWYEHPEVPRGEVVDRMLEFSWVGLERVAAGAGA